MTKHKSGMREGSAHRERSCTEFDQPGLLAADGSSVLHDPSTTDQERHAQGRMMNDDVRSAGIPCSWLWVFVGRNDHACGVHSTIWGANEARLERPLLGGLLGPLPFFSLRVNTGTEAGTGIRHAGLRRSRSIHRCGRNSVWWSHGKTNNIMKNRSHLGLMTILVASACLVASCSDTPAEQRESMNNKMQDITSNAEKTTADTPKEWEKERQDILGELRDLRNDIDDKLGKEQEKLADKKLKPSERTDCEAMAAELTKEKGVVESHIKAIETSEDANWNTNRDSARAAMTDFKSWWAKQKEKMDRKTDADNDHDGH